METGRLGWGVEIDEQERSEDVREPDRTVRTVQHAAVLFALGVLC